VAYIAPGERSSKRGGVRMYSTNERSASHFALLFLMEWIRGIRRRSGSAASEQLVEDDGFVVSHGESIVYKQRIVTSP